MTTRELCESLIESVKLDERAREIVGQLYDREARYLGEACRRGWTRAITTNEAYAEMRLVMLGCLRSSHRLMSKEPTELGRRVAVLVEGK